MDEDKQRCSYGGGKTYAEIRAENQKWSKKVFREFIDRKTKKRR